MSEKCVALLGRVDLPTDGVEEYCRYLGEALREHDLELALVRVSWAEQGWAAALAELRRKAAEWRGCWVLVQYTALGWSKRGFPQNVLRIVGVLRRAGARIGIVYHDVNAFAGQRLIDRIRRAAQLTTMRRALLYADRAVLTVPPDKLSWLPATRCHFAFIPVGANLPIQTLPRTNRGAGIPTVAVFSITGGDAGKQETQTIVETLGIVCRRIGALRLEVFGRHAELREDVLREGFSKLPVQMEISGVLPAETVARKLCASDVLLFVRGAISSRRGSAIAGIACGLPVIAYSGAETAPPITEAGVVLLARAEAAEIAEALVHVLSDQKYHDVLAAKSRMAHEKYFSWTAIAARYAEVLRSADSPAALAT